MDLARLAAGVLHLPADASPAVALAADELGTYLRRMVGRVPARRILRDAHGPWLRFAPAGAPAPEAPPVLADGLEYQVEPRGDGAVLVGTTPRALLAAAYALLEAAGCRWSPLGRDDEHVPGPADVRPEPRIAGRVVFPRRVWASDLATWHYGVPERLAARLPGDLGFVDWMAKTGATGFFFIRHANDTQWVLPELLPALAERGLEGEAGGHALVELLPRALFAAHPEYFPVAADGRRSDFGNACASSRLGLALVRERALLARDAMPGRGALHVWGLDLLGGGWCRCPECAALTPSDQALRVCNAVAEGRDDGRLFHLAYHDTIRAPETVRPGPCVWAEFAPRERCYAHALDDPGCARNRPYHAALERHLAVFDGRVEAFEYYGDAILFGGCAVPLVEVIGRDLAAYARAGVRGVSCLVFGRYSLWAYGANVDAFATAARRPADAVEGQAGWAARFGADAAVMSGYAAALERAMRDVVTWGDVRLPPRQPERAAAAHAALGRALACGADLRRLLDGARGARVDAERRLLDYTLATLVAVRDWLGARRAGAESEAEDAITALGAALAHVREAGVDVAGTWGLHDLEVTHAFFAAALRAAGVDHDPFA
jgi:hypothetical protein